MPRITRWSALALLWTFASVAAAASAQVAIRSLSSPIPHATGGDALIEVTAPASGLVVKLNGENVTSAFRAGPAPGTYTGLVTGLATGPNVLAAYTNGTGLGRPAEQLTLTNHPITGPVFSGPHQQPYICETVAFGLGPPLDEDCSIATRVEYVYRSTAGGPFRPLDTDAPRPADVGQTTTIEGNTVPFIVRLETGTINRAIYQIAMLHEPGTPLPDPWTKTPGWNGRLGYTFGGGLRASYRQGRYITGGSSGVSGAGILVEDLSAGRALAGGFAMASATQNVNNTSGNDVISAETAMMVKERFIEQFGPPLRTIGFGSSGGAMQQHLLAHNYPGILDGIIPQRSFPDQWTFVTPYLECALLDDAFNRTIGFTDDQKADVAGHITYRYCTSNFPNWRTRIDPVTGCDPAVPPALIYDPVTNPDGARCTIQDNQVNIFGIELATGFARRLLDNVGVQYGLDAFNAGSISFDQFLQLNTLIGGFDADGQIVRGRMVGDPIALATAYRTGRVNSGAGLDRIPIIDIRNYLDPAGDVHDAARSLIMRARLIASNGHADNQVIVTVDPRLDLAAKYYEMVLAMDEWLAAIDSDTGPGTVAQKVVRNKPSRLVDSCYTAADELVTDAAACDALFPRYENPRLAAGEPVTHDILKCQLKPVTSTDYAQSLSAAQLQALRAAFPQGVCDYDRPGVGQQQAAGTWLAYPAPGQRALTPCTDNRADAGGTSCLPSVDIAIVPDVVNLRARGGQVVAVLTLEGQPDLTGWTFADLRLAGAPALAGSFSADRRSFVATFDRGALLSVPAGDAVMVTVTGRLQQAGEGAPFAAGTVVRVLR